MSKNKTRFVILGGLGEIGKNMYALEHEEEIIIIDAGISFAELTMLGIDYLVPDYTYLKENEKFEKCRKCGILGALGGARAHLTRATAHT